MLDVLTGKVTAIFWTLECAPGLPGDLDQDKRPGIIRDPVVLVRKLARNREIPILSVPLWLLGLLAAAIGGLGYRRLRSA